MRLGTYVRIEKLRSAPGGIPACPLPNYAPGVWGGLLTLPVAYTMEGFLLEDLKKDGVIRLDRRVRHGVRVRDAFVSTRVCSLCAGEVTTFNSIYRVTATKPPSAAELAWRN
jgi:hypothetical protein